MQFALQSGGIIVTMRSSVSSRCWRLRRRHRGAPPPPQCWRSALTSKHRHGSIENFLPTPFCSTRRPDFAVGRDPTRNIALIAIAPPARLLAHPRLLRGEDPRASPFRFKISYRVWFFFFSTSKIVIDAQKSLVIASRSLTKDSINRTRITKKTFVSRRKGSCLVSATSGGVLSAQGLFSFFFSPQGRRGVPRGSSTRHSNSNFSRSRQRISWKPPPLLLLAYYYRVSLNEPWFFAC